MKKIKITTQWLKKKEACEPQLEKFKALFPKGIVLTKKLIQRYGHLFDLDWLVEHLSRNSLRYSLFKAKTRGGKSNETAFVETFLSEPRKVKTGDQVMLKRDFIHFGCYGGELVEVRKVLSPTQYLLAENDYDYSWLDIKRAMSVSFKASRGSFELV